MTAPDAAGAATLVVSEVFGPTFQGEGASLGRRAGFVRLGRCNLACAWCDTPYTWDWSRFDPGEELQRLPVDAVAGRVAAMDVGLVVVTGGEPLLQQRHLPVLLQTLRRDAAVRRRPLEIEVETAGTITPDAAVVALVDRFNVSPKLANSGMPEAKRLRPAALAALRDTGKAVFKFVVTAPGDLEEVDSVVRALALSRVWVMPEGTDAATVTARLAALAEPVLARGWNLTPRLHVLLWGDRRGV